MPYVREISEDELLGLEFMRELRRDLGITQNELGKRADITRQSITNLERGRNTTTWPNALVLLQRLGCRVVVECPDLDRVYVVKGGE